MASDKGRMMKKWNLTLLSLGAMLAGSVQAMTPLSESDMARVSGQGLIVSETITGSGPGAGFDFIRMGLDARLSLNANIDKMQLGCGGFNEVIRTGCDIDMDFVRFMGLDAEGIGPGAPGSDFVLTRPYIELATKGTGTTREVVGLKIGAQETNGYFGVGREYEYDSDNSVYPTNLENGGVCGIGSGRSLLACHSGINSISGYMNVEISGRVPLNIIDLINSSACFGRLSAGISCPDSHDNNPVFRQIQGTRVTSIRAPSVPLTINICAFNACLNGFADLTENLRFVHGFALDETKDFALSFQREKISWPGYDKVSYSEPANAGWWMNVPYVAARDIKADPINLGFFDALEALSAPGYAVTNVELNSTAPDNCFGTTTFC